MILPWQTAPRPFNGLPCARSRWVSPRHPRLPVDSPWIAFGQGRSYGDVCVNDGGTLLGTAGLDRFLAFDAQAGLLRVEAGVMLDAVLALVVPQGWFLPVTPGTRFISMGGAVANDVHGKNHHRAGSLGGHVTALGLLRSDHGFVECGPARHADLFAATVGGLGLTGLICWVELRLRRIASPMVEEERQRFESLDQFHALSAESDADPAWEYSVAWVDCDAPRGRGVFHRGRHAPAGTPVQLAPKAQRVPLTPPFSLINGLTRRLFNPLHFYGAPAIAQRRVLHYEPFFYPLDALRDWNRLYGPRGFYQHQSVVPLSAREAVAELLQAIRASGQGSALAVLKTFGPQRSPGLLSFPRPGITLAVDFPNHGGDTLALLERLDAIVCAAGGAIYPAKDARMSAETFRSGFPQWAAFSAQLDPACSSSFWRRVTAP